MACVLWINRVNLTSLKATIAVQSEAAKRVLPTPHPDGASKTTIFLHPRSFRVLQRTSAIYPILVVSLFPSLRDPSGPSYTTKN